MTIRSYFRNKINHGSSGKVKVLLKDLCIDLILPFDFKLLLLMFFMNTVSSCSREDFIVSTFLVIKFNAESTDKDLFTI